MSRNEVPGLNGGATALNGRTPGINGAARPNGHTSRHPGLRHGTGAGEEQASLGLSARGRGHDEDSLTLEYTGNDCYLDGTEASVLAEQAIEHWA